MVLVSKQNKHIAEIDGLRAIAVISVILFHAEFQWVSGGFVGVDIFFVISGYLITGIIFRELYSGNFTLSRFWYRRIKRIAPASLLVSAVVLIVAFKFYPYEELIYTARSTLTHSLLVSNIFFWADTNYFSRDSWNIVMLHTWSLSVEEQFYVIFPLGLIVACKFLSLDKIKVLLIFFVIFSFVLSIIGTRIYPSGAYYLLPTRAWEIGAGGLLAIYEPQQDVKKLIRKYLLLAGYFLLFSSIFFINRNTPFPSFYALFPVIGTILIILAREREIESRSILRNKYLVFIGLISYSLYLWHWPVLVFGDFIGLTTKSSENVFILLVAILLLSIATYYLVEKPCRNNNLKPEKFIAIWSIALISMVMSSASIGMFDKAGKSRNESFSLQRDDFSTPEKAKKCQDKFNHAQEFVCRSENFNNVSSEPFFVWGDSHTTFLMPAIQNAADSIDRRFSYASYSGCPPVLGITQTGKSVDYQCIEFNHAVFEYVITNKIKKVLMVFRHNLYLEGFDYVDAHRRPELLLGKDNLSKARNRKESNQLFIKQFNSTIKSLKDNSVEVIVLHQIPNLNFNPSKTLHNYLLRNISLDYAPKIDKSHFVKRSYVARQLFIYNNLEVIDLTDEFCDESVCDVYFEQKSLYRDYSHLGKYGNIYIQTALNRMFKEYLL